MLWENNPVEYTPMDRRRDWSLTAVRQPIQAGRTRFARCKVDMCRRGEGRYERLHEFHLLSGAENAPQPRVTLR